jgi:integrase
VLPRRRRGRADEFDERRFLTSRQLGRLLAEIPEQWRTLFEPLASAGLPISEAIGLRVMDARLNADAPCVHVRRAIVIGPRDDTPVLDAHEAPDGDRAPCPATVRAGSAEARRSCRRRRETAGLSPSRGS